MIVAPDNGFTGVKAGFDFDFAFFFFGFRVPQDSFEEVFGFGAFRTENTYPGIPTATFGRK